MTRTLLKQGDNISIICYYFNYLIIIILSHPYKKQKYFYYCQYNTHEFVLLQVLVEVVVLAVVVGELLILALVLPSKLQVSYIVRFLPPKKILFALTQPTVNSELTQKNFGVVYWTRITESICAVIRATSHLSVSKLACVENQQVSF